ncbi:hypothetical protein GEMRC1_002246 [Eukaryota sp. GEM-RC1]
MDPNRMGQQGANAAMQGGQQAAQFAGQMGQHGAQFAQQGAQAAMQGGQQAAQMAGQMGQHGAQFAQQGAQFAQQGAQAAMQGGQQVWNAAQPGVQQAGQIAGQMGQHGAQLAQQGAQAAMQGGQQVAQVAGQMGQQGAQIAQQGAQVAMQGGQQVLKAGQQAAAQGAQIASQIGEQGKAAAEAMGSIAGNVGGQLSSSAVEQSQKALSGAADAAKQAQELAAKNAPQFVSAASYVVREGGQFAAKAASATKDLWNSDIIKNVPRPDFSAVSSVYSMSRDQLARSIAMLTGAARFLFDFVKFDLFRDFGQIISLFFVSFSFGEHAARFFAFFNRLASAIALNVQSFLVAMTPLIWFYVFAIISFVMLALMLYRIKTDPDDIRDGHEVVSWEDRKKLTRLMAQINLTALTSFYLAVSRNSLSIMLCREEFAPGQEGIAYAHCYEEEHIVHIVVAICSFSAITMFVPILCYRLIKKNRPKPRYFDAEGKPKEYTLNDYHADLKKDKCPYAFLYDGYERNYSAYKVFIMVIKFLLVTPIVILTPGRGEDDEMPLSLILIREGLVVVILLVFAIASFRSSPFIRRVDDKIDQSARTTTVVTAFLGIGLTINSDLFGAFADPVLAILHTVNALLMVGLVVSGMRCTQLKWQQLTGRVHFSKKDKQWDLFRERKLRIWHPFWESLFVSDESLKPCFQRLAEIKEIVEHVGFERYKNALLPIPQDLAQERYFLESQLEGIDVYWYTENVDDGKLDSKTCFGKLWIKPFPFQCVFVYDDSDDFVMIPDHEVIPFAQVNRTPEVVRRRSVRQQLRCLNGQDCYFFYQCWKNKVVDDGTDSRGNRKTKTIKVFFTFTRGILSIGRNRKSKWSAGFKATMRLYDGVGSAQGHDFTGENSVIGHSELGIDYEFSANQTILRLLYHPNNSHHVGQNYPQLMREHQEYRNGLMQERRNKELTLSWGFWFHVFNNDRVTRQELEYYLTNFEHNHHLKMLPQVHKNGLDFVYCRLMQFNAHPAIGYWITFWLDLWEENFAVKQIKVNAEHLNPMSPSCIAYTPIPREELEGLLRELGLMRKLGPHLDQLYGIMDHFAQNPFPMY